ncbi:hypothetical protein EIN_054530 [Entamoeba invadens IP1]|uniref:hypothetical protein n=1 Tax=Entamoeba invadens IP1 TaxID=370355 RepID=UPI0002C3D585|nr:hypothetical protein EIN_054530 [Entamoeba invadens IP1]ELP93168.1 hypothetical protein EIN_054530 [Entamoeba invadens IP1]|eukprot:XP_004259939.1 hypothetical protein EIN_054530 [Entamoeba invadens IP1]
MLLTLLFLNVLSKAEEFFSQTRLNGGECIGDVIVRQSKAIDMCQSTICSFGPFIGQSQKLSNEGGVITTTCYELPDCEGTNVVEGQFINEKCSDLGLTSIAENVLENEKNNYVQKRRVNNENVTIEKLTYNKLSCEPLDGQYIKTFTDGYKGIIAVYNDSSCDHLIQNDECLCGQTCNDTAGLYIMECYNKDIEKYTLDRFYGLDSSCEDVGFESQVILNECYPSNCRSGPFSGVSMMKVVKDEVVIFQCYKSENCTGNVKSVGSISYTSKCITSVKGGSLFGVIQPTVPLTYKYTFTIAKYSDKECLYPIEITNYNSMNCSDVNGYKYSALVEDEKVNVQIYSQSSMCMGTPLSSNTYTCNTDCVLVGGNYITTSCN